MALAQLLQMCFFAGIVIAMGAKKFLPEALQKIIDENPLPCMMLVFFCNMASGAMLNTGAFEVTYDGTPIWSKVDSGRFPNIEELKVALTNIVER